MEKKQNQNGAQLLPVLLCCLMLACSGIVFGVYSYREIAWLKIQIREHQKVIDALQSGKGLQHIPVRSSFHLCLPRGFIQTLPLTFSSHIKDAKFTNLLILLYKLFRNQRQLVFGEALKDPVLVLVSAPVF